VEIEYFVDQRRTGRTANIVADLFQETGKNRCCRFVVVDASHRAAVIMAIESHGIPRHAADQIVISESDSLRGIRIDTLYIDNADYMRDSFRRILERLSPERVVVVLTGKLYKRIEDAE
jgi:hypothetical protein